MKSLEDGDHLHAMYTDLSKVFDRDKRMILLCKMEVIGNNNSTYYSTILYSN